MRSSTAVRGWATANQKASWTGWTSSSGRPARGVDGGADRFLRAHLRTDGGLTVVGASWPVPAGTSAARVSSTADGTADARRGTARHRRRPRHAWSAGGPGLRPARGPASSATEAGPGHRARGRARPDRRCSGAPGTAAGTAATPGAPGGRARRRRLPHRLGAPASGDRASHAPCPAAHRRKQPPGSSIRWPVRRGVPGCRAASLARAILGGLCPAFSGASALFGARGLRTGTAASRATTWAGASSRPRKSPAKYGISRPSTVAAKSPRAPTSATSMLGTNAPATARKKKATA